MNDEKALEILKKMRKELYEHKVQSEKIKGIIETSKDKEMIDNHTKRLAEIEKSIMRCRKAQRVAEDHLQIERKLIDALARCIEKTKVPMISRDTKKADIRLGSRLYEFKVRHSKGELDEIKLEQLKKIHPDILEPTNKIRWNQMFESVRSYCRVNQTHTIQPSKDKRKEKLRWWLSNQIKLINAYFKKHDNSLFNNNINDSRHDEMTRRNTLLIEAGLKADLNTGRFLRPLNIASKDSEINKRRLIRSIDYQVKMLREIHKTDYISIVKDRILKQMSEKEEKLRDLNETKRIAKFIEINEPSVDKYLDDDAAY